MHAKTIHLHGGPCHGQTLAIPADRDSLRIVGVSSGALQQGIIQTRTGRYSQVSGPNNQQEFEWDGWE